MTEVINVKMWQAILILLGTILFLYLTRNRQKHKERDIKKERDEWFYSNSDCQG